MTADAIAVSSQKERIDYERPVSYHRVCVRVFDRRSTPAGGRYSVCALWRSRADRY